eukprot:Rhum_TRINITY_DN20985_c0_g1::Rhum_TRINITY_DN20985_c0_g1_i1::g.172766::m.172766
MPPKAAAKVRRGLSEEEKTRRTLAYLHETLEPTTVKDLIKVLPKAKGVPFNNVEACVKELLGDDLINMEKVGINTLVWSFPATAALKRRQLLDARRASLADTEKSVAALRAELESLRAERCCDDRPELLRRHAELSADAALRAQARAREATDANAFEETAAAARAAIRRANMHAENIMVLANHLADQRGMSVREVLALCEVPLKCTEYL